MKTRPWPVKVISLFFLLVPFAELLIVGYARHRWHVQLTSSLLITGFGLGIGSIITAFGVWKVRPWGFYVMIVFGLVIIGEDAAQMIQTPDRLNPFEFIDIILVVLGIAFLNMRRVREPYFNPKIRWWERSARHATDIPVSFTTSNGDIQATLLDISGTGCFAKLAQGVKTDEFCVMKLKSDGMMIEVPAKVMRVSENPQGVGFRFFDVPLKMSRELKHFIRRLQKQASKAA